MASVIFFWGQKIIFVGMLAFALFVFAQYRRIGDVYQLFIVYRFILQTAIHYISQYREILRVGALRRDILQPVTVAIIYLAWDVVPLVIIYRGVLV